MLSFSRPQRVLSVLVFACILALLSVAVHQRHASNGLLSTAAAQDVPAAPPTVVAAFNKGSCINCHTVAGVPGANGQVGPDLSMIGAEGASRKEGVDAHAYIRESILEPNAFIAEGCPGGACPSGVMLQSFAQTLSETELDTIVTYLATLGTGDVMGAVEVEASALSSELPAESVLEPFAALPKEPANAAQIALGKYLFFDSRLSGNTSLSCASCHQPENAFTDGEALSRGYPSTAYFRNTPTLLNTAFSGRLYWDGRMSASDMPTLVRDHLTEAHFMSMDGRLMVERLNQVPEYVALFEEAFGSGPGFGRVLNALTAYVQSLNSPATPYDSFLAGESDALASEAQAGLELFEGKANCSSCHGGEMLSDYGYYNTGVGTDTALLSEPERELTFRRFFATFGTPNFRNLTADVGGYILNFDEAAWATFRTPSLREVGRTAPYMHDGSLATLEEVVQFYNAGGGAEQTAGLAPLNLNGEEVSQLVAFLVSLSSEPIKVEVPELPDYQVLPLGDPDAFAALVEKKLADAPTPETGLEVAHPPLAPLPELTGPPDNLIEADKVELGRLLFFDPRLSADGAISCASCHPSSTGWGAATPISFGGAGTSHWRNAQTVLNTGHYGKLNWDGSKGSIEKQNKSAWGGAVAGNLDGALAEARLAQIPEYVTRFEAVFGAEYPTLDHALDAVATYQRTLNTTNTPFDAFISGDEAALSDEAKRGYDLFTGDAGCVSCHNGPLASDDDYHATGVPQHPDFFEVPLKQITFRYEQWAKGTPEDVYRSATDDLGLYYQSKQVQDMGKFRTPSLRDLCYTAPYMHNGVFASLDEVVAFYNEGGGEHFNKDSALQPLNLDAAQQGDLVAFLESLCGDAVTDTTPELPAYGSSSPVGGN